jgi:hypothetical protein
MQIKQKKFYAVVQVTELATFTLLASTSSKAAHHSLVRHNGWRKKNPKPIAKRRARMKVLKRVTNNCASESAKNLNIYFS